MRIGAKQIRPPKTVKGKSFKVCTDAKLNFGCYDDAVVVTVRGKGDIEKKSALADSNWMLAVPPRNDDRDNR